MPASKELNARRLAIFALGAVVVIIADARPLPALCGALFCLVGECFRLWGCGHLEKNEEVTNTGAYAHVQNPLYLGTILIILGLTIAGGNWPGTVLGALFFFGYYFPYKVRTESDRMRRRFGERYHDYFTRVPKLIPRLSPYPGRGAKRWSLRRVAANSELGAALAVLLGLLLVGRSLILGDDPGLGLAPQWAAELTPFKGSWIYLRALLPDLAVWGW